ncbi:MAG: hypothetical protein ED558_11930 [Oricola sp.]|nr:MAG: hypothetical protein ED558_11930 [Oricola sp.]
MRRRGVRRHAARISAPGGIDAIAGFVYSTAINAKKNADDRQVLEQGLAVLKASVLAWVNSAA